MAQTGYTPISIYYSSTASNVPTAANLVPGELAINTNDGKLYYEDSAGVVRVLASKSTGSIGGSTTEIQYNNAGSLAGNAGFTFDGTIVQVKLGNTATTQFRIAHSSAANYYADYNEKGDLTVGRNSWSSGVTTDFSTTSATSTYTGDLAGGFSFKPRGSTAVTIAGNGNVGIGVTPSAWQAAYKALQIGKTGVWWANSASDDWYIGNNYYYDGSLKRISAGYATEYAQYTGNHVWSTAGSSSAGSAVSFTERMRIDSSGNLLVGCTTIPSGSTVGVGLQGNLGIGYFSRASDSSLIINTNTDSKVCRIYRSGSEVGDITVTTTTTSFNSTSDYRLKTVIGAVTGQGERIDALEPIEYTWNSNGLRTRGFLAHKFQEVYANSVTGIKDGVDANGKPEYQSMQASTSEVIADLVAEIQSLRQRITTLENK